MLYDLCAELCKEWLAIPFPNKRIDVVMVFFRMSNQFWAFYENKEH